MDGRTARHGAGWQAMRSMVDLAASIYRLPGL